MPSSIIPPPEDLKQFVRYFWISSWSDHPSGRISTYYSTADICTKIVFAFTVHGNSSEFLYSGIQGQTQLSGQFPTTGFQEMIGVSFYPYAVPLLFNMPARELSDQLLTLDDLIKEEATILNEKLAGIPNLKDRLVALSGYFRQKLTEKRLLENPVVKAMHYIIQRKGNININEFVKDIALSQKQFERKFLCYAGFTPKIYSRIVRFEHTLEAVQRHKTLTELAYASGYYDQSHFIHDFRKFSGFSPMKFFALMEEVAG